MRIASLLLLTGCLETGLTGWGRGAGLDEDGDPSGGVDGEADGRPQPERCNGVDDDRDGLIDEGFPDVDGDGTADCRDEDCTVALLDAGSTPIEDACIGHSAPSPEDPFDLVVEWTWREAASVAMPAVGLLTDDDGDGDVDTDDIPDIVFSTVGTGEIVALSGDGSGELWRVAGFRPDTGVALADVDADGAIEVIAVTRDDRVRALEADGRVAWTSADRFAMLYPVPTVADLDADGLPEVIADTGVVRGTDGSTVADLGLPRGGVWRAPVVVDLDRDGQREILLGTDAFAADGTRLWSSPVTPGAIAAFAVPVQADGDPQAEVAWAVGRSLTLHEHDGTVRTQVQTGGDRPGPPCAADLDGDGHTEIVVPARDALTAYTLDGTERWSTPIDDSSGAAGCAVFDMDGDLAWEVVYADMDSVYVLDGTTGEVLFRDRTHASVTYFETPVVADVDADGSAEIVVAASGYHGPRGITVFGHAEDGWPAAGPAWGVHDFQLTNTSPLGTVPRGGVPGWERYGLYRGRPAVDDGALPDLTVSVDDLCVASCVEGGLLRLSWRVHNQGEADARAGVEVAVQTVQGKIVQEIARERLPAIAAGTATASRTTDLPWTAVPAGGDLQVVVDPEDRLPECDEDDNAWVWSDGFCPR